MGPGNGQCMATSIGRLIVHIYSQVFARLKVNCTSCGNIHTLPRAWIATNFWGLLDDRKAAKTANLNARASHQSSDHCGQKGVYGKLDICAGQLAKMRCHFFDEVRAIHLICGWEIAGGWSQVSLNGEMNVANWNPFGKQVRTRSLMGK